MRVFSLAHAVWAATTKSEAFIRMVGLSETINHPEHRKEIVAGNLGTFLVSCQFFVQYSAGSTPNHLVLAFRNAVREAGDYANGFWETVRTYWNVESHAPIRFTHDIASELPKVASWHSVQQDF